MPPPGAARDTRSQVESEFPLEPRSKAVAGRFVAAILDFQTPDGDIGHPVKRLRNARPVRPLIGTSATDRRSEFADPRFQRVVPLDPWMSSRSPRD